MKKNNFPKVIVILVEPSGPINLGSIARLCENYGVHQLRLISPKCDPLDPQAKQMALKGKYFLEAAKKSNSLIDAISDCQSVIATCGRIDHDLAIPLYSPEKALEWFFKQSKSENIALVFGREDRGLTNQELQMAQKVITIETESAYPSLNLSHAVGILLHQLYCSNNKVGFESIKIKEGQEIASPKELNDYIEDSRQLLLEIGFLMDHTAESRMQKIKALLQRGEVKAKEISMLRGILHQMRWAIDSRNS